MRIALIVSVLAGLAGLVLVYWAVFRVRLGASSIRNRLLLSFVAVSALPAIAISLATTAVGYSSARSQAVDRLGSVAARKQSEIRVWSEEAENELALALHTEYAIDSMRIVLNLADIDVHYEYYVKAVRVRLMRYLTQSQQGMQELDLLDRQGQIVLSSDAALEGSTVTGTGLLDVTREGSGRRLGLSATGGSVSLDIWLPVLDLKGEAIGSLAARYDPIVLSNVLEERIGLGRSGAAYLLTPDLRVGVGTASNVVGEEALGTGNRAAAVEAVQRMSPSDGAGSAQYVGSTSAPVVGAFRRLPELQAVVVVEQDQSEAFGAIYSTLALNVGIALTFIVLAALASLLITRGIARPLVALAGTASRIAGGDLQQSVVVERHDEIGAVASAFNSMTAQLRGLIGGLEERVAQRTRALERRALQLETNARVSREVTSILDIDSLLVRVAELIRSAFQYYHVNVFLVDGQSQRLILRANSGDATPKVERLELRANSLNAEAVRTNGAVLSNDVARDPRFAADQNLPQTLSELVAPLRAAGRIVGTLDVHSMQVNAFAAEDVLVIQSLADQIAIAIENARLYLQSRELATLEERNRLARELHDVVAQTLYSMRLMVETWRGQAEEAGRAEEARHLRKLSEVAAQALKETRVLVHELRPSTIGDDGLLAALHRRLYAVEQRSGVETHLVTDSVVQLPGPIEEQLFGIATEALNNSLRHSRATHLTVRLHTAGDRTVLEVEDDGVGFDPDAGGSVGGFGLTTMRERASRLGSTLQIQSKPGRGTVIRVSVPAAVTETPATDQAAVAPGDDTAV